jgi:iron complex outermembrane receptor protein
MEKDMNARSCGMKIARWLFLPVAIILAWPSASLFAQEPMEEVITTGTRIRQDPLEERAPILSISREDLDRSGLASVGDFLQRLSISGSPLNTKFNSSGNFGFPPDGGGIGAGATQVDLRHFGCKRVLVLMDGERWINGASASGVSSCVDLNNIPMGVISNIEVLTNGAGAVYGSDAITGVVNIITKSEVDGIEMSGYVGEYDDDDGETKEFSLSMGAKTDEASAYVSLNYYKQDEVKSSDRGKAGFPVPNTGVTRGSSGTPQARIDFTDPNTGNVIDCTLNDGVVNDGLNNIPFYDPADPCGASDDFHPFSNEDRFNFAAFNLLVTPSERWNIFGKVTRDITENVSAHLRGSFSRRESNNTVAPEPIFIGTGAGTGGLPDAVSIDATNPYNPFGFSITAPDDPEYFLGRRPIEFTPRSYDQEVDTWAMSAGLDGSFDALDRNFYWDFNSMWSKNTADQLKEGAINAAKLSRALGPVDECSPDGRGAGGNFTPGADGCVPLNLFGGQGANGEGSITPDMLRYIGFVQHDQSEQELIDFTANLGGSFMELPAGEWRFAVGAEHREESGSFQPDPIIVAGDSNGVPSTPTNGSFNVNEFYGETQIPILDGMRFAEHLDVTLAARDSDYNTSGSETTKMFGVFWQPYSDLSLRYNFAEGFRAPGIGELFGNVSRFDADLADSCSNFNVTGVSQEIINNCISQGVPADGSYAQFNPQISIATGGNKALEPETSDTTTIGLSYDASWVENVSWIDGLSADITYYDIKVDDAIQAVDAQTQLDQCALTNDPALCGGISRTASGVINGFANQLSNIAQLESKGMDINLFYNSPAYRWGEFGLSLYSTYIDEFSESSLGGNRDLEGIEENDSSIPEWKSTFIVDWMLGNFAASWTVRYIDEVTEVCSDGLDGSPNSFTQLGLCSSPNTADESLSKNDLDSTTYQDVQVTWMPEFGDGQFALTLGANNIFDEDPPTCYSCSLNGYDAGTYDAPGQFYYLRSQFAFGGE